MTGAAILFHLPPLWAIVLSAWLLAGVGVALIFGALAAAMARANAVELGHRVAAWWGLTLLAGLLACLALQATGVCTCLG